MIWSGILVSPSFRELFTTPVSSNYHPLTILSMRLNNNVCDTCPNGISPVPFIRWNVIIHILNTLLVLILVFLLSNRNILVAMLSALLFGVHPMHVESVAWISERKDVLYTFFFLSGIITYLNFIKEDKGKLLWYLFTFILFLLSCLSKATAVVFPVALILINFMVYRPEERNFACECNKKLTFSQKPYTACPVFYSLCFCRINGIQNSER